LRKKDIKIKIKSKPKPVTTASICLCVHGWSVGWLEVNGSFSTKRLYRAVQKLKFVKDFFIV